MELLKFKLKGRTAFFKNPDVNANVYFTFGHIHKVSIMGLIGATIGLNGYNQAKSKGLPEFYEKLKDIKISICPKHKRFNKKVLTTTNRTGYASNENGGILIVKEQVLENVEWDIYIQIDRSELELFKTYLINEETEFAQYLGKNEHLAEISDVEVMTSKDIKLKKGIVKIDSLCQETESSIDSSFKYYEFLPVGLDENTTLYKKEKLQYTDGKVECEYLGVKNKNIVLI